jgi:hypothetical protein
MEAECIRVIAVEVPFNFIYGFFSDLDNRLLVDQGESLHYETDEYFINTEQSGIKVIWFK